MHTISQRQADGFLIRTGLVALWFGELLVALAVRAAMQVVIWQERASERRRLASLDDFLLRDMGLTRSDIHVESRKPFWEA
jgi:uncharacterized protein YjiS (DUF1127 family)